MIRIPPYHYVHVLDLNSNVTRVEVGPHTYIRQDHERWVLWGSLLPTAKDVDAVAGGGGAAVGWECHAVVGRATKHSCYGVGGIYVATE